MCFHMFIMLAQNFKILILEQLMCVNSAKFKAKQALPADEWIFVDRAVLHFSSDLLWEERMAWPSVFLSPRQLYSQ